MHIQLLGASISLTGPEARYGRQILQALELALDDEGCRSSALVVEDDASDPNMARAAAETLAANPRVAAVVGPMNSWTCEIQAPIYHSARLVHITPSASNPQLAEHGWDTFCRMCPDDRVQGNVLALIAAHLVRAQSVAAVHDSTSFGEPLAGIFLDAARKLGLAADCMAGMQTDVAPSVAAAAEAVRLERPDAVLVVGLEAACRRTAEALRAAGVDATLLGTDAIKPTRVLVTPGAPAAGPYLTNSGTDARHQAPAFHERFSARHGAHDSIYTVEAYDAARVLLGIIRRSEAADRDAVRAAVRAARHQGLSGPIHFTRAGERSNPRIGIYRCDGSALAFLGDQYQVLVSVP